jgi:hypothetical protein
MPGILELNTSVTVIFFSFQASIAMKIFGNELRYHKFSGNEEIMGALNSFNPVDKIKHLLSGKVKFDNFESSTMIFVNKNDALCYNL